MPRGHPSGASPASEEEGVSHWRAVMRSKDSRPVRGGAVGKMPQGNSLAAYSTACPVREGAVGVPRKGAWPPTSLTTLAEVRPRVTSHYRVTERGSPVSTCCCIRTLERGDWPRRVRITLGGYRNASASAHRRDLADCVFLLIPTLRSDNSRRGLSPPSYRQVHYFPRTR
jgi:hypothetical protein